MIRATGKSGKDGRRHSPHDAPRKEAMTPAASKPITCGQCQRAMTVDEFFSDDHACLTEPERQRYATPAVTAPLLWHYLDGDGRTRHGWRAICGERRRRWERLETFSVPSAADPCQMCVAINEGMQP